MKNIADDMVLGYRNYVVDRKTRKDFVTLESVADWISQVSLRDAEVTQEFFDFIEQEYNIEDLINIIELLINTGKIDFEDRDVRESIEDMFLHRNDNDRYMSASEF